MTVYKHVEVPDLCTGFGDQAIDRIIGTLTDPPIGERAELAAALCVAAYDHLMAVYEEKKTSDRELAGQLVDAMDALDEAARMLGISADAGMAETMPALHRALRYEIERKAEAVGCDREPWGTAPGMPGQVHKGIEAIKAHSDGILALAAAASAALFRVTERGAGAVERAKAARTAWCAFVGGTLPGIYEKWTGRTYGETKNNVDREGVRFVEAVLEEMKYPKSRGRANIAKLRTDFRAAGKRLGKQPSTQMP